MYDWHMCRQYARETAHLRELKEIVFAYVDEDLTNDGLQDFGIGRNLHMCTCKNSAK